MRTTVLLDIPIVFFIGGLFVLAANRQIRREGLPSTGRHMRTAIYYSIWWGLVVGYFYARYPDWMWSYFIDPSSLPWFPSYLAFMAALILSAAVGAVVTHEYVRRGMLSRAVLVAGAGLAFEVVVFAITGDRYTHVGTFEQYYAGSAPTMSEAPGFSFAMNVSGVLLGLPVLYIVVKYARAGWGRAPRPSYP